MQAVNFFFVNALLFASLIAVVGVPVLYVTQPSTEEGQRESRREKVGEKFILLLQFGLFWFLLLG